MRIHFVNTAEDFPIISKDMSIIQNLQEKGICLSTVTCKRGYTLVELVVVIIIVAVLASITMRSMRGATDIARTEETKQELDKLAFAIVGNQERMSGGSITDFGYVGDVGALPDSLGALVINPGGYSTWDGPYIRDEFTDGSGDTEYCLDAWGKVYSYSGGVTITSSGSGSNITRQITNTVDNLIYNTVSLTVTDLDNTPPGSTYGDSIKFILTYPDGSGSTTSATKFPGSDGYVQFDSIPIGQHQLKMIYIPSSDTSICRVTVNPASRYYKEFSLASDVW